MEGRTRKFMPTIPCFNRFADGTVSMKLIVMPVIVAVVAGPVMTSRRARPVTGNGAIERIATGAIEATPSRRIGHICSARGRIGDGALEPIGDRNSDQERRRAQHAKASAACEDECSMVVGGCASWKLFDGRV